MRSQKPAPAQLAKTYAVSMLKNERGASCLRWLHEDRLKAELQTQDLHLLQNAHLDGVHGRFAGEHRAHDDNGIALGQETLRPEQPQTRIDRFLGVAWLEIQHEWLHAP